MQAPYEPESCPQILALDDAAEWQGGMHAIGVFEDSFKIEGMKYSIFSAHSAFCIDVGGYPVTHSNL